MMAGMVRRQVRLYRADATVDVRFSRLQGRWGMELMAPRSGWRAWFGEHRHLWSIVSEDEPRLCGRPVRAHSEKHGTATLYTVLWSTQQQHYVAIIPVVRGRIPRNWGNLVKGWQVTSWPMGTVVGDVETLPNHKEVILRAKTIPESVEAIRCSELRIGYRGANYRCLDTHDRVRAYQPLAGEKTPVMEEL